MSFVRKNVLNLYISYELGTWSRDLLTYFTQVNCWFGAVKLTKNVDLDKYRYSGYGIGLDSVSYFLPSDGTRGKMLFLEFIWAHLCMLIIKENYLNSW